MSEEERKDIANCISSLLTSTTRRMTVRQLQNDFQNTVGYRIPFRNFGCYNVVEFLRTLGDKVQVFGTGDYAEVQVVVNEKTAHINDLVSKQKVSVPRNSRKSFNRYNSSRQRRSFNCAANYNSSIFYTQNRQQHIIDKPFTESKQQQPIDDESFTENRLQSVLDIKFDKAFIDINREVVAESRPVRKEVEESIDRNSKLVREEACIGRLSDNLVANAKLSEPSDLFFSDDDEEFAFNIKVPQTVQDNLKQLILKHPDGIWSSNLLEFYKKEFGKFLNYTEYGYRSVAQMCADLRNIFSVVQLDKSDVKLFNKNQPIPQDTLNVIMRLQLMKMKADAEKPTDFAIPEGEDVEQLMGNIYSIKVPTDVVEFGTRLEQQWLEPGTNEQDYIDVNVGEVYDPSKFWINFKLYGIALNTLMDDMQVYYAQKKDELAVPYLALRTDLYVACIYAQEYHRARIVDTSQKNERVIKVYFVDYGTVSVISIDTVCYLRKQFAELPEQAVRARLAGIFPPSEDEQWSRAAASRFLNLVMQKDLVAQIVKIDEQRKILDIVLADTSEEEEDFFINDALVHLGYAIFTFQVNNSDDGINVKTSSISSPSFSASVSSSSNLSMGADKAQTPCTEGSGAGAGKKLSLTPKEILRLLENRPPRQ